MRQEHYKPKSYRLNKKTVNEIEKIKRETELSYNLIFVEFIRKYKNE